MGHGKEMAQLPVQASGTVEELMQSITMPEGNRITWAGTKKTIGFIMLKVTPKVKDRK